MEVQASFCKVTEGRSSKQFIARTSEETVVQIRVLAVQDLVQLDTKLKGKKLLLPKSTLEFETPIDAGAQVDCARDVRESRGPIRVYNACTAFQCQRRAREAQATTRKNGTSAQVGVASCGMSKG